MSATAWVVTCTACKCVITCFAIDPQAEHGRDLSPVPPLGSCILQCPCCDSAYRYAGADMVRGVPKRNPACQKRSQPAPAMKGALLVAASIVAAIRLRGEPIKPSPKVVSTVSDSVQLARMVVARLERDGYQ